MNAALIKFFEPVMLSGTDYYPFGMAMRIGGDSSYRYGFNGKENDNEVKGGDGNQQDYGMRIYDSRIGRFLSEDPVTKNYPELTPYQFGSNNPIENIDLDGLEGSSTTKEKSWWDLLMDFFFSQDTFNEGGSKFIEGAVQKTAAKSGTASYNRPEVPTRVQAILAQNDIQSGNAKMVDGATDMYIANGQTSANLVPVERALTGISALKRSSSILNKLTANGTKKISESLLSEKQLKAIGQLIETVKTKSAKATEFFRLETLRGNADARSVGDIMKKMLAGVKFDPIEVYVKGGKKYVLDGHHRLEAATRLGREIEYKELTLEQAMKKFHYTGEDHIMDAATEASIMKNKIDNGVVKKAADINN